MSRIRSYELVLREVGFVIDQGETVGQGLCGEFSVMSKEGIRAGPHGGHP